MIRRIALGLVTAAAIPVAVYRAAQWAHDARIARLKRTWIEQKIDESNHKLEGGDSDGALLLLLQTIERQFNETDSRLVAATARLLSARGEHRALSALRLMTDELDAVVALESRAPREAALALSRRGDHEEAAKRFAALGEPVHAAIALERAGEHVRALEVWTRLPTEPVFAVNAYYESLCRTKLGRSLRAAGDDERGLGELRRSIELARGVMSAASTEPFGRAFDAASLVIRVAGEIGDSTAWREAFEWCIADLEANRMDFPALQFRIAFARQLRGEGHALDGARILARGVEYAARIGAEWEAALAHEAACAFEEAARAFYERNAFDDARAAWEEAAERFAARNEFPRAAIALEDAASIPTLAPEIRTEALSRAGVWRARNDWRGAPDLPAGGASLPPVEDADLLAVENDGDAARVCGDLLVDADPHYQRRSLGVALIDAVIHVSRNRSEATESLARALRFVNWYAVLDVFEKLLRDDDPRTRAAAASALWFSFFPRTIALLRIPLGDIDERVRSAARETLRQLHPPSAAAFVQAIAAESTDTSTRNAALASLGRTQSDAAVDALIDFAVNGNPDVRALATSLLASHPHKATDARIRFALACVEKRVHAAAAANADRARIISEGEALVAIQHARRASRDDDGNERGLWGLRMRRRVRSIRNRRDG